MLQVRPVETSIFKPGDNLVNFISSHIKGLWQEGQIIAVTSKIVSLAEKRLVTYTSGSKEKWVREEADTYLGKNSYDCHLTIKEGLLLPSAGIDESNSQSGDLILYPQNPFKSAQKLLKGLKQRLGAKKMGIIITDSHTKPLRRGVMGCAVAYCGFKGVRDKRGEVDLFDRPLKMTQINVADALASAAVLMMGEGAESCPLALIDYAAHFCETLDNQDIKIPVQEDLYHPLFERL